MVALACIVPTVGLTEAPRSGSITVSAPDATSSRLLYVATSGAINGLTGMVYPLTTPLATGSDYKVVNMGGLGGVFLRARFYEDISGVGVPCGYDASGDGSGGEQGTIDCGMDKARYVIVFAATGVSNDMSTLQASVDVSFKLYL